VAFAGEKKNAQDIPLIVREETAGDWVVERFAGNNTAGSWLYQGPAREVGGLQCPNWCVEGGDGTIYLVCGLRTSEVNSLMQVTPDGTLRLVMQTRGLIEGPMGDCQAGYPIWNPKEKALYVTGPNCLRKIVEKPDGSRWVEVVVGIPNKAGNQDGPAKKAMFNNWPQKRGVVCNSRGVFFWIEGVRGPHGGSLRRIENGMVSTVPLKFKLNDPEDRFNWPMGRGMLSLGENDDTLYINSYWVPRGVFRCDLKTGELTRICGVRRREDKYKRRDHAADGPALTHADARGAMKSLYDPFHNAIWVWGPDEGRFRWLRLDGDGWVRTVFAARRPETKVQFNRFKYSNVLGVPGEQIGWAHCCGVDSKGGVYVQAGNKDISGFWRAHNKNWPARDKKEVKP